MHEYPLTLEIIGIAAEHAAKAAPQAKVKAINLVIGESSGVLGEAIALYFDILAENTPCEGAELNIRTVKPLLKCRACGGMFERRLFSFDCPVCGGDGMPTEVGREFYVEKVEVKMKE